MDPMTKTHAVLGWLALVLIIIGLAGAPALGGVGMFMALAAVGFKLHDRGKKKPPASTEAPGVGPAA